MERVIAVFNFLASLNHDIFSRVSNGSVAWLTHQTLKCSFCDCRINIDFSEILLGVYYKLTESTVGREGSSESFFTHSELLGSWFHAFDPMGLRVYLTRKGGVRCCGAVLQIEDVQLVVFLLKNERDIVLGDTLVAVHLGLVQGLSVFNEVSSKVFLNVAVDDLLVTDLIFINSNQSGVAELTLFTSEDISSSAIDSVLVNFAIKRFCFILSGLILITISLELC